MLRNSSTYIYLAVALGLVCYLTFIDKKIAGTKESEDADNELFKLDPDEVTKLEITNVHGLFIFQKNDNHWEVIKPVDTPADGGTIDGIVSQIAYAQPKQVIKADKFTDTTLKEWGLAPADERVVIHTKDHQYELLVGRKVAINDSVYARASGRKNEEVRVIPSTIKEVLQKDLSDFRSRNVFDFDQDKVTKIATRVADTPTSPGLQCEVELKDGTWTLQMPLVARASSTDVQSLITRILGIRAADFITDDASNLSAYGLTSPRASLTVSTKNEPNAPEEDTVLQIGDAVPNKPDEVYAQRLKSNSVFALARSSVDDLLKALPNVRDRHVFPFDPARVSNLSFSLGTKKVQLRNEHGSWIVVGEAGGPADSSKVADLLARLSQLETTPVLKDSATDLKPFGLDKPQGKITLQSPEFKPESTLSLLIGQDVNKLLYVRNSAEPFIYTVPETAFDFLPANNLAVRDARAIDLDFRRVKGMTVTAASLPPVVLTRSSGGTWTATNVKDRMVNSTQADTQSSLLCQLQAKAWLGPVQASYGLAKPVLTFAVQTDKPSPTVLRIGALLPDGGHAAQVEGQSTAFEISDGDFGILNASSVQTIPDVSPGTNAPSLPIPAAVKK